jgi:hypothetical protein
MGRRAIAPFFPSRRVGFVAGFVAAFVAVAASGAGSGAIARFIMLLLAFIEIRVFRSQTSRMH